MESKFSPVYTDKILLIQRNILHHQQFFESYTKLLEPSESLHLWWRLILFAAYNHGQKSWDTFVFLGVFQFTQAQPLPSPHKQCWTRVSRTFSGFQHRIGWGEREQQEKFEKDTLLYEETQNERKICITVPRTFVHYCSFDKAAKLFHISQILD